MKVSSDFLLLWLCASPSNTIPVYPSYGVILVMGEIDPFRFIHVFFSRVILPVLDCLSLKQILAKSSLYVKENPWDELPVILGKGPVVFTFL